MGRKIRTDVPQVKETFVPKWPHIANFKSLDEEYKRLQKTSYYDKHHRVRALPSLPEDEPVWVETRGLQTPGRVSHTVDLPRSYVVETASGCSRRNHTHLRICCEPEQTVTSAEPTISQSKAVTRSQTGTVLHPPDCLRF